MLSLNFIDASEGTRYKATIQVTGRLSFNAEAAKYMELHKSPHFKVAFDIQSPDFTKIYLVESDETPTTAKVYKAGNYNYLKLERPLKRLGIEFLSKSFTFIIEKMDEKVDGKDVFLLSKYKVSPREGDDVDDGEEEE